MKHLEIASGLVVVVVAGLMAILAAPAMAVPRWVECVVGVGDDFNNSNCTKRGGTEEWSTKELAGTSEVTSSGGLELEDEEAPGGAVNIKCTGSGTGWVSNVARKSEPGEGGVTTVTNIKCSFVKHGECEESAGVTAKPLNLPWGTKLLERGSEVRDEIPVGAGWNVECTVAKILKIQDKCEAVVNNTANVVANRSSLTVESVFDERTKEETMAKCTASAKDSGLVRGTTIAKLRNGNALWVQPPSEETAEVATAPRWVDCAKVGESEGHFSSGSCTTSGSGWETKELAATSEVTSSGELELEDEEAPGGAVNIKCTGSGTGWVSNVARKSEPGEGGVTTVTNIKCSFVKHGECEESAGVTAKPLNLPWGTKLLERGSEVRDEIPVGAGWNVECTVAKILKIQDKCEAVVNNTANVVANRSSLTVESVFDERTKEETMAKCTASAKDSGLVRGTTIAKLRNGNALWVVSPN